MTHLIFIEFVGFDKVIPLWLNEGVAQWEDRSKRDEKPINEALRFTYPKEIYTIELLEKSWHGYLKEMK